MNVVQFQSTVTNFAARSMMRTKRTNEDFDMEVKLADQQILDDMAELKALKADIDKLTKRHDVLKKHVTKAMGECTTLCTEEGEMLATYRPSETFRKIDLDQVKENEPDLFKRLDNEYGYMSKAFRTFRPSK